jgi:hypothetical protein
MLRTANILCVYRYNLNFLGAADVARSVICLLIHRIAHRIQVVGHNIVLNVV